MRRVCNNKPPQIIKSWQNVRLLRTVDIFVELMRVHPIKEKTVADFVKRRAISRSAFLMWMEVVKSVDWNTPENIHFTF